jgi:hypothetical protein|tara:strand:+ start:188 stop:298 length:111 start_codon:yes stop_codon:yes gene_type:complete
LLKRRWLDQRVCFAGTEARALLIDSEGHIRRADDLD